MTARPDRPRHCKLPRRQVWPGVHVITDAAQWVAGWLRVRTIGQARALPVTRPPIRYAWTDSFYYTRRSTTTQSTSTCDADALLSTTRNRPFDNSHYPLPRSSFRGSTSHNYAASARLLTYRHADRHTASFLSLPACSQTSGQTLCHHTEYIRKP